MYKDREQLKPCPFCGGEASIVNTNFTEAGEKYVVGCLKCGIELPHTYLSKTAAEEAWNRRSK